MVAQTRSIAPVVSPSSARFLSMKGPLSLPPPARSGGEGGRRPGEGRRFMVPMHAKKRMEALYEPERGALAPPGPAHQGQVIAPGWSPALQFRGSRFQCRPELAWRLSTIALSALLAVVSVEAREPRHAGKPVSYWIEQ